MFIEIVVPIVCLMLIGIMFVVGFKLLYDGFFSCFNIEWNDILFGIIMLLIAMLLLAIVGDTYIHTL